MGMKQQTAVDWLHDCIPTELLGDSYIKAIFKTAKEKEKQHIVDAYNAGSIESSCYISAIELGEDANMVRPEQYFLETFKQD